MKYRRIVVGGLVLCAFGFGSAWAQIVVTDPTTTGRNAVIAVLRNHILETVRMQQERLRAMAERLSAVSLARYRSPLRPEWRAYQDGQALYADSYRMALRYGDPGGAAFGYVARSRLQDGEALASLNPAARDAVARALATLDAADSTLIASTHLAGVLRWNSQREQAAVDELESDVTDPSDRQSATAVLDKVSAATLLETRQKQARLQYLSAIVEQLVVDNKRARDTESALLNMQLHRLRRLDRGEDGGGMLSGASTDLRTWRQP